MDLIDEQDRPGLFLELGEHPLEALLEIAAILRPGHESAEIQGVYRASREHLRHLVVDDHLRKSLGDRRLTHTRLAHEQGIVLAAATQDLDRALDLAAPADQRIDAADPGHVV